MSLTGNVNSMPLPDLLQVTANNGRTCVIVFANEGVQGRIFFVKGALIHATCGSLEGDEAVHALLHAEDLQFKVENLHTPPKASIDKGLQTIILEAAQFQDELARAGISRVRQESAQLPQPPARKRKRSKLPMFAVAAILLLSLFGLFSFMQTEPPVATPDVAGLEEPVPQFSFEPEAVYEATDLTGPRDQPPTLISGKQPVMPEVGLSITPTITCRVLIDPLGFVKQSQIYRSRLELASLEALALEAVADFRFSPGKRAGATVATWINWPVTFATPDETQAVSIHIKGSDTIGGKLGPDLARAFSEAVPGAKVMVEGLGSSTAFVGLFDGSADIGAASRSVKEKELAQAESLGIRLHEFVIGYDGIAVIVHPSNQHFAMTVDEISRIFTGETTHWQHADGSQTAIRVISRPNYSGTHSFFKSKVLRKGNKQGTETFAPTTEFIEHSEEIAQKVAADPSAIAYLGLGWASPKVKVLRVSPGPDHAAVAPTLNTIRKGTYPIYRPLLMYTREGMPQAVKQFLGFTLGKKGQALVEKNGFVACDTPAAVVASLGKTPAKTNASQPQITRIWFPDANAALDTKARNTLGQLASQIKADQLQVVLVGHADAQGNSERNQSLAQYRALNVAKFLRDAGIDSARIKILAGGEEAPLATNETLAGRAENRRVDIYLARY